MSVFSDYLELYINTRKTTVAKLASSMDMDRSIMYRYVKGQRVPESEDIVKNIAVNLCLSAKETEKLMELYDRQIYGDERIENYIYSGRFLSGLKAREKEFVEKTNIWHATVTCNTDFTSVWIDSREDLMLMIRYMFETMVKSDEYGKKIYMITNNTNYTIHRGMGFCFDNSDVTIEHIICLEKSEERRYRNLDILLDVITTRFANVDYSVFCYYGNISSNDDTDWLPNVIITDEYVVQFDNDMQNATCVRNREFAKKAREKYRRISKNTFNLSQGMPFEEYTRNLENKEYNYDFRIGSNLMFEPGVIYAVGADLLETNMVDMPQKKEYIEYRKEIGGIWNGLEYTPSEYLLGKKDPKMRFQYDGLIRFMETGCSSEFPNKAYIPFEMKERITVLKRMIELSKMKIFDFQLIDNSVELPEKVLIYSLDNSGGLIFALVNDFGTNFFRVGEVGFQNSFRMYIEELERKGLVKDNEETRKVMERVCREYEKKL